MKTAVLTAIGMSVLALGFVSSAQAGEVKAGFNSTANVLSECVISNETIDMGEHIVVRPLEKIQMTSNLHIDCTGAIPYSIGLNTGGSRDFSRNGVANSNFSLFFYQDSGYTTQLNSSAGQRLVGTSVNGPQAIPIYVQAQNTSNTMILPAGDYVKASTADIQF